MDIEIEIDYDPFDANDATGSSREILWRNSISGQNILWSMEGPYTVEQNDLPTVADSDWKVAGMATITPRWICIGMERILIET